MKHRNTFLVGVLTTLMVAAAGCAGDTSDPGSSNGASAGDENVGQGEWQVALVGAPAINGCATTSLFSIAAPFNQNVGFVAANAANLNAQDISMLVFTQNQYANHQAANVQATQAFASTQRQHNLATTASANHSASASDADHVDETVVDQSIRNTATVSSASQSSASHSDSATQQQAAEAAAAQNANAAAQNNAAASQVASSAVPIGVALPFDGIAPFPGFSTFINNAFQAATQAANQNAAAAQRQAASVTVVNNRADTVATQMAASQDQIQQLHQAAANHTHDTVVTSADNAASATQESLVEINQALQSSNLNQQLLDQTMVMNTQQLAQQHLLLQVTTNQATQNLNVLTGTGPVLGTSVAFPFAPIPGCVDP